MNQEILQAYPEEMQAQFIEYWKQISRKVDISDVAGPPKCWPEKWEELPKFPVGLWPPSKDQLAKSGNELVQLALDLGATDARVISARDIPLDIRSLYVGCLYPNCRWLDTNMFCPLKTTYPFEEMQELVNENYDNALVFKVLPPKIDSLPDVGEIKLDPYYTAGGRPAPDRAMLVRNIVRLRILDEITRRLRQVAYYSGCICSIPMGNGPCIVSKCANKGLCEAKKSHGICPFRGCSPNSPIAYVDYHTLGRNLGWGQYQIGGNCSLFPEEVLDPENYYNIGLILLD
jgi:predicted metal-binding protein